MYTRSAVYYDSIYSYKNYEKEANTLERLIRKYKRSHGNTLLDVGCGTGGHVTFLRRHYRVQGLDLNPEMLRIAREKNPGIRFYHGDMVDFNLKRKFDVIVSLFSAIGHVKTLSRLRRSVRTTANHLQPGGVLIIEPWFTPDAFRPGSVHSLFVNRPELKIARMNISNVKGRLSIMDMHHLIGTPEGIRYFIERLELGLFTKTEYRTAIRDSGLKPFYDSKGLIGRGLYLGTKPIG